MRSLVWHGDTRLAVEEHPAPRPRPGQVLVDVSVAGICGSDLHGYRGHPGPRVPPLVLGHEAVGTVPGRSGRFALFPLAVCGACAACLAGREQLCVERGLLGMDRPGVFAEQIVVAEGSLVPVPESVPDVVAALTEPYAVGLSVVREDAIGPGTDLLLIGGGPIGALTAHAARQAGATVTAVEPLPARREVLARLGAEHVSGALDDIPDRSFDIVVDAVGIEPTWAAALRTTRRGGRVTIVGLGTAVGTMRMAELVREAITVRGAFAYSKGDFDAALLALADAPPELDWLSWRELDDAAEGFRDLVEEPDVHTKVMLRIGGEP
jgi:threonine dehydrogenase-like Zn-dependent dehydrogenase